MMFDIESARKLLTEAGVFYSCFDEDDEKYKKAMGQTLNMNDTWCWASAYGEYVPDEKLPEVAELFWLYGNAGLLYWVSEQNNGMRSEFHDNNRCIDFVKNEEEIREKIPDSSERAYKKISYTIGTKKWFKFW